MRAAGRQTGRQINGDKKPHNWCISHINFIATHFQSLPHSILPISMWPRSFYNWAKILTVSKRRSNLNVVELSLWTCPARLHLHSWCPGVFIFSHNIVSFRVPFLFSNVSFLLFLMPVHLFRHFHSFSFFFFTLEKPPSCFMCLIFTHPNSHFQIEASQLPGAGWRWYEQMKVGFTVLTEISNSSISALRQSKKPTAACLEAASKRKKKAHICMFWYMIAWKQVDNKAPMFGKTSMEWLAKMQKNYFTQWNYHVTYLKQAKRNYLHRTIVHAVSWTGQTAPVCISQSEITHSGLGNSNSIISTVQKCLWWMELSLRWVPTPSVSAVCNTPIKCSEMHVHCWNTVACISCFEILMLLMLCKLIRTLSCSSNLSYF